MSFANHAVLSDSPKEILKKVNEDLFQFLGDSGLYMTAFFMVIDQNLKVRYTSAGHPPVIFYNNHTNNFEVLKTKGLFVGAFEDAWETYQEGEVQLKAGDRLILYTDGIIEARNNRNKQYGMERVEDAVMFSSALPSDKLAKMLINDVRTFVQDRPITDDMSILVIEVSLGFKKFKEYYCAGKEKKKENDSGWVRDYLKAFSYNQDHYEVAFNLGLYYYKIGEYEKARECFERLIANKIVDPEVYFYMAQIYIQEKKYIKALAFLKDIVKNHPHHREALSNIAFSYYSMAQYDKALLCYRELEKKYPRYRSYKEFVLFIERKMREFG
jgi:tetratricopeptide (TPR) repeat protein